MKIDPACIRALSSKWINDNEIDMTKPMNISGVLDHMDDNVHGGKATIGNVIDAFGGRGYGPILLALSLVELLPTGAIPGVPTMLAILIVLIAGQLVLGRRSPWIPYALRKRGFSEETFATARGKVRPLASRLDKVIKPRLTNFSGALASRFAGVACILLACTMPPLELVPFASSMPSSAIALFGIGLSAEDGLFMLIGFLVALAAIGAAVFWLFF